MRRALAGAALAAALASADEAPVVAVYRGTLPCADCAGVDTELTIRARGAAALQDARFWLKETYRGGRAGDRTFESGGPLYLRRGSGADADATVYELQEARSRQSRFFRRVGEVELRELDAGKAERRGAVLLRVEPPK